MILRIVVSLALTLIAVLRGVIGVVLRLLGGVVLRRVLVSVWVVTVGSILIVVTQESSTATLIECNSER